MRGASRVPLRDPLLARWTHPHIDQAVDSPECLTTDAQSAARILEIMPNAPTAVWGRDELRTEDMWNSNSLISWLIARS
jgi:hypothetical protein